MVFLDPTSDIAFKKLFGDQKHKSILIGFLNSILRRENGDKIVDVTTLDPNNRPDHPEDKVSIVDARCVDQSGKSYILEMQKVDQKDYAQRSLYYAAKAIVDQVQKKEKYSTIQPVIFIGVLKFNLFTSPDYLSDYLLLNTKTHEHGIKNLELHYVELLKFNKTIDELVDMADRWTYLLKNAEHLEAIPSELQKSEELQDAFETLERGNWTQRELDAYERYLDSVRCQISQIETAIEKGVEKGMARGLQEGLQKGLQQGLQQGEQKKALEIARAMLSQGFDEQVIATTTGLSLEQITEIEKH